MGNSAAKLRLKKSISPPTSKAVISSTDHGYRRNAHHLSPNPGPKIGPGVNVMQTAAQL